MTRRYSLAFLAEAAGIPLEQLGSRLRLSGTQWKRARDEGVGERAADRYAVKLGLSTLMVWPEMVDHALEDSKVTCPECEERFVPTRKGHTYCSHNCRERRRMRVKYQASAKFRKAKGAQRRAYYEQCSEYEKASARKRYWADPERQRQARRERHHRGKVAA